ncbi:MAG TPA: DUF2325 domain-containing protein [Nitrosomonas halophila]|nr:DUF2325 domain-containing protein [Nitrosomonas halophila]
MTVLIVGGDHIASLKQTVRARGYSRIEHWNGRKKGYSRRTLPGNTEMVVILCDCVNHNLVNSVKDQASRTNIKMIFSRRSVHEINKLLIEKESDTDCCRCYH